MFRLRKWYLDCTGAGPGAPAAFIGYSAALEWGGLHLGYASSLVAPCAGDVIERHTFLPGRTPAASRRGVGWSCRRLGVSGAWHRSGPPIRRTLLRSSTGAIEWACLVPAAAARVRTPAGGVAGLGYVERLELTLEPWRLPFHTLHWGRFLAPGTSLVWIVWEGDEAAAATSPAARSAAPAGLAVPATLPAASLPGRPAACALPDTSFVFRDSCPCQVVEFSPSRIVTRENEGTAVLVLAPRRTLRSGAVVSPVLRSVAALAARIPAPFLMAQEDKWLSQGSLEVPGRQEPVRGWAIHEIVRFR